VSSRAERLARRQPAGRLGLLYKAAILAYLLAVVLLSYREGLTAFAKGAGVLLVGLFVFRAVSGGEKISIPKEFRFFAAWFVIGIISSALSKDPVVALYRVGTLLQVVPLAWIIVNLIQWNGDGRFYWWAIIGAALVSGGVTLASPMDFRSLDGRLFGTLSNANAFAVLVAVGLALSLGSIVGARTLLARAVYVGLAAFFLYLVAETGSRMGMVASLVAMVVIYACHQATSSIRNVGKSLGILLLGVGVLAGSLYFLTSSQFASRLEALTEGAEKGDFSAVGDNSLRSRVMLMEKALELALENPLIGVGLDVYRTAGIEYRTIGNNSHSNYLEILASTGILGGVLFFAMYFCWWQRLFRLRYLLKDPDYARRYTITTAIATQVLVFDLAWVSYYEKLTWILLAGLIAETVLLSGAAKSGAGRGSSLGALWR